MMLRKSITSKVMQRRLSNKSDIPHVGTPSMNNYWSGKDKGGEFPAPRVAQTPQAIVGRAIPTATTEADASVSDILDDAKDILKSNEKAQKPTLQPAALNASQVKGIPADSQHPVSPGLKPP